MLDWRPMKNGLGEGDGLRVVQLMRDKALPYPLKMALEAAGVTSIQLIDFGEDGRILPHDHEVGVMEVVVMVMKDASIKLHIVLSGGKHVYPEGVRFAVAIKIKERKLDLTVTPSEEEKK